MRVLFVTGRFPARATRGDQVRAFEHIRALSARHAIILAVCGGEAESPAQWRELVPYCEGIHVLPLPLWRRVRGALRAACGGMPLQVGINDDDALRHQLLELARRAEVDLIHVQLARLGLLTDGLDDWPRVVDLVDALSVNMRRRALRDRGLSGHLAAFEARRLARYEPALCGRAAAALISCAEDRAALGDPPHLHVAGNGVDPTRFGHAESGQARRDIVFVGNLGYFPNVDAIGWFARQVMGRVLAGAPGTRLRVVGARPAASLRRDLAGLPGVDLIGPVADVSSYLARAAVAVAPMRAGSGQQLKILEAMACGTPVVCTSLPARALGFEHGRHLLVADDEVAMADAVLSLLGQPELGRALAGRAWNEVLRAHTWAHSAQVLEQAWTTALARHHGR